MASSYPVSGVPKTIHMSLIFCYKNLVVEENYSFSLISVGTLSSGRNLSVFQGLALTCPVLAACQLGLLGSLLPCNKLAQAHVHGGLQGPTCSRKASLNVHFPTFCLNHVCYYHYRPKQITWPSYTGVEKELIGKLEFVAIFYPTVVRDWLRCSELFSKTFPLLPIPQLLGEFLLHCLLSY